jgi:hypothetical protein
VYDKTFINREGSIMKSRAIAPWTALCLGAGFLAGSLVASAWVAPRTAQAATVDLPPIFQVGAKLSNTIGDVQVIEIAAPWIRVKSLNSLDEKGGENWWIYVPAQSGAWRPGQAFAAAVPN